MTSFPGLTIYQEPTGYGDPNIELSAGGWLVVVLFFVLVLTIIVPAFFSKVDDEDHDS